MQTETGARTHQKIKKETGCPVSFVDEWFLLFDRKLVDVGYDFVDCQIRFAFIVAIETEFEIDVSGNPERQNAHDRFGGHADIFEFQNDFGLINGA